MNLQKKVENKKLDIKENTYCVIQIYITFKESRLSYGIGSQESGHF
jgi:hypothetical protein